MRFKQATYWLIFLCVLFWPTISGANSGGDDIIRLLPRADEISPWQITGQPTIYVGDQLFTYIDGGADIYLEYGFDAVINQEYSHGERSMVVDIYRMQTPQAAFGIYSTTRDHRVPRADFGDDGAVYDYQVTFWQDNYYVIIMVYSNDEDTKRDMVKVAKTISSKIHTRGNSPEILKYLPQKNRVPRSEKYVKGLFGLNNQYFFARENIFKIGIKNAEGIFSDYTINNLPFRFFLAKYHSSKIAQAVFNDVIHYFKKQSLGVNTKNSNYVLVEWKKERYFVLKQKANLIGVLLETKDWQKGLDLIEAFAEE